MKDGTVRLRWKAGCFVVAFVLALPGSAQAQSLTLQVVDTEVGGGVEGAVVELLEVGGTLVARLSTARGGTVTFANLRPDSYSLLVSALGFETRRVDGVTVGPGDVDLGRVELDSRAFVLNPVVVTVSRNGERSLDAPASVYSVDRRDVAKEPGTTVVDHIRDVPGVDVAYTGLARPVATVRGFQTAFSSDLLVLTDNRWSSIPSLRFNAFDLMTTTDEDIERIEVVLGPGAALYGPNVVQGVMHVITKSPFDAPGTTVSLGYGERSLFQASARHAGVVGDRFAFKVSGKYLSGSEWRYDDPVEQANRAAAIAAGADPATLLIGQRDFDVERWSVDSRFDVQVDDETTLTLSGGRATIGSGIALVSTNASQVRNWSSSNLQLRLSRGDLFAQSYVNWSGAGDTYSLRSGDRIVDESLIVVTQAQNRASLGDRQRFTYGVDFIRTIPRTGGTTHGSNEDRDDFYEVGGYLQSETELSDRFDFVAAARVDRHGYLDATVFSPRAALVFTPSEGHSLRATWNRAFRMPSPPGLFVDLVSSPTLGGLPFAIRAAGMPLNGYQFRRDCGGAYGGLCMRSPFMPEAFGGPMQAVPVDATPFWDAAVGIVAAGDAAAGGLLGAMNAPSAADVGSGLLLLNTGTGSFDVVNGVSDIDGPRPPIHSTFEVGYKGLWNDRLLVGFDVYYNRVHDFISEGSIISPNVFMDPQSLGAYITSEAARLGIPLTAEEVAELASGMASIPLGTVTPEGAPGTGADIIFSYRNFGAVDWFGSDVGLSFVATDRVTLTGSYSRVSDNVFADVDGVSDINLNTPKNRGALGVDFADPRLGISLGARGRFVQGFPFSSGVFAAFVDGYQVFDLRAGYDFAAWPGTSVTLSASNVFDNQHLEIAGSPRIGRLISMRLVRSF